MPRKKELEDDVFVCCREPAGLEVAGVLAAGLSRLGFHVRFAPRGGDEASGAARFAAIEEAPDFILVMTPDVLGGVANPDDPVRAELAHALRCRSIVVPVCLPGVSVPKPAELPDDLRGLSAQQPVRFDPAHIRQSIALVAHSLSSDAEVVDRTLMTRARVAAGIVAFVFVSVVASFVVPAVYRLVTAPKPKPPLPPYALSWAGIGQRTTDGHQETFGVGEVADVLPGDRLKLVFSPGANGFAYVIARSARGEVSVLFPGQTMRGASAVQAGAVYEAPSGREWLTVDQDGAPEELFVIASYDALENLEELAEEPDARTTAAERADLLSSTLAGLMDGRHASGVRYARTRTGHTIDPRLRAPSGAPSGRATLDDGVVVERPLAAQTGAISVAVDVKLRRPGLR